MKRSLRYSLRHWIASAILFALSGLAGFAAEKTISDLAVSGDKDQAITTPPTTAASLPRPSVIYVTDFHMDATQIEQKKLLDGQREGIRGRRPHLRSNDPVEKGRELVHVLSDSIVKHLKDKGLRAESLPNVHAEYVSSQGGGQIQFTPGGSSLPKEGWLMAGWFEKVEEGRAAVEATVGFGAGSGKVEVEVMVSDLAGDPGQPFLVMGSGNRTKKMPGGLVTMNPYVMAAKFVLDRRQGTEKDVKNLGAEIAKSLIQYIDRGPTQSQ